MKIEKLNNRQIRCVLTKEDLMQRELRISELAYGTDKAKALFHDMMEEASELGFEAEDIPLMIEAIPVSAESLELIVTKVEDPDELDTRFSKFTEFDEAEYEDEETEGLDREAELEEDLLESAGLQELFAEDEPKPAVEPRRTQYQVFRFEKLDELIVASGQMLKYGHITSSLYRSNSESVYYLILERNNMDAVSFSNACSMLSEYGKLVVSNAIYVVSLKEHMKVVMDHEAVSQLASLN